MSSCRGTQAIWWDREFDAVGKPIRLDVRAAAHEIWEKARGRTQVVLGDPGEAAPLMERSVVQLSRYLDRVGPPKNGQEIACILMCAFSRSLRKYATKLHRVELVDDLDKLPRPVSNPRAATKEDCRIDAEKLARRLSPRGRRMLDMRTVGYEWKEIAAVLNVTACAARAEFSREVKKARMLEPPPRPECSSPNRVGMDGVKARDGKSA